MKRLVFFLAVGLGGAAILISLGIWQMQRLAWKQDILAQIAASITDAPVALPQNPDPEADKFLAVSVEGYITTEFLRVLVSKKQVGAGYRIISPFVLNDRTVLLDRGFVRVSQPMPEGGVRIQIQQKVIGNLHWPQETDDYTPAPDLDKNIWFARDVAAMAAELNTDPVLIVARETSPSDGPMTPMPVDTAGIPNDHLQYAITWFSLAAIWLMMSLYFLRPTKQSRDT